MPTTTKRNSAFAAVVGAHIVAAGGVNEQCPLFSNSTSRALHGVWHLLGAASFVFWYRHYRQVPAFAAPAA